MIHSRLQVIDCAGSQTRLSTTASTENSMINASLISLHNTVRLRLEQ
jgi:hypothetical protein